MLKVVKPRRSLSIAIRTSAKLKAANDLPVLAAAYSFYSNRKLSEILSMDLESIKYSMEVAFPILEIKARNPANSVNEPVCDIIEDLENRGWKRALIAHWITKLEIDYATGKLIK
jgi:hypothetical protein